MKELSIEEKAKRYDEAIEIARKINSGEGVPKHPDWTTCEVIFPELKESEDERMWLTKFIQEEIDWLCLDVRDNDDRIKLKNLRRSLAWLEKQAEHADFLNKIQIGDKVTRNEDGVLVNLSQLKRVSKKDEKQEWSEEDERIHQCLIKDQEEVLDKVRNSKYGHSEIIDDLKETYRERINWLKSLKERYSWKPSDEQMEALSAINVTGDISYVGQGQELINLYNELKKLKDK